MSVTLDHVSRTVDGIPTIRDVSLTLESGTLSVQALGRDGLSAVQQLSLALRL